MSNGKKLLEEVYSPDELKKVYQPHVDNPSISQTPECYNPDPNKDTTPSPPDEE